MSWLSSSGSMGGAVGGTEAGMSEAPSMGEGGGIGDVTVPASTTTPQTPQEGESLIQKYAKARSALGSGKQTSPMPYSPANNVGGPPGGIPINQQQYPSLAEIARGRMAQERNQDIITRLLNK